MTHVQRGGLWLAIALVSAFGQVGAADAAQAGVVVEEVSKGSGGKRAGIQPGDVLLGWERPGNPPANPERAEGKIDSVFDWMWVAMEQAQRGPVRVAGERDGRSLTFEIPIGSWGISVRPRLDDRALNTYMEGKGAVDSKEIEAGLAVWIALATTAEAQGDTGVSVWLNQRVGQAWTDARRWADAQSAYAVARDGAEKLGNVMAQSVTWEAIGTALTAENRAAEAETAYTSAFALREKAWGDSLCTAWSMMRLGIVAGHRGNRAVADDYMKRALAIRERLAPNSLDTAQSFSQLGLVAQIRGDLPTAEGYYRRAAAIHEQLEPESQLMAFSLDALGSVARARGELSSAENLFGSALAIEQAFAPNTLLVASYMHNLGLVATERGDLSVAENHLRRALAIKEQHGPDTLTVAATLAGLGDVARRRNNLQVAESYFTRALAITEKAAPNALTLATYLNNLGNLARRTGDLSGAKAYLERALAIQERLAPGSLFVANALGNLGSVARSSGDLDTAAAYLERGLAVYEKLAPDSVALSRFVHGLGLIARDRGELAAAEGLITRGLGIREKLTPGSADEAESHYDLALIHRRANRIGPASEHLRRAIAALEAQQSRVGGGQEAIAGFGAQFAGYYREYIDVLAEQDQAAEAFQTLERSRARTLLSMMVERDLVFTADVPEALERERKRNAREYDQVQARLARLSPVKEQPQIQASLNQMREVQDRQSQIIEQIREQSPRLASLQYPQPLDVRAAQAVLDPGTALLSYSIGQDTSHLFVVTPGADVRVHTLAVGERQLREEIERFRSLIQRGTLGAADPKVLVERGRRLHDLLVHPAAETLRSARRILVVPDGPLHVLPFAALVRSLDVKAGRAERDWQYLVEWKPLHVVVSATVYAELRKSRAPVLKPERTLIAFGNPTYSSPGGTDGTAVDSQGVVRSMLALGYQLSPLPATATEVTTIARLYKGNADVYLADAATEARAKTVARTTRYLHFAVHGWLDQRFPLNSGLALTIPQATTVGDDNGILQAWEIFERMRIDADLVVLSACETALGKEMGGEGLLGLTRAFQYAGARSVLASLWSVADDTTAVLMARFYEHLKAGESKDAALRAAQLDLIRGSRSGLVRRARADGPDASHPYYWAAFQLNGDWR